MRRKYLTTAVLRLTGLLLIGAAGTIAAQGKPAPPERAASRDSVSTVMSERTVNRSLTRFPARVQRKGPVALHLQILLDRANFSPGIIDGAWGINADKALSFFANPFYLDRLEGETPAPVPAIDRATYDRLRAGAGPGPLLTRYRITREDVAGPFTTVPDDVYDQAKLKCLCYSSAAEALGERFHTSQKLLAQLNPRVKFDHLEAGTEIVVPNVRSGNVASPTDTAIIAKVVISKKGFWTHALDSQGKIIYHFPSTLGAGYDPSPTGDFKVTYVSRDPAFHYQPKLFSEVPDDRPEARLPAGPNSPVGVVWMSLSKPHYGIHGTSSPETIGYANSHGCVRLTNWDALHLSDLVEGGTRVEFH